MKEEMRESYFALKKIARDDFIRPLRAFLKRNVTDVVAKYEPVGPTAGGSSIEKVSDKRRPGRVTGATP
jgi:hypothetical protein